ncbi:MAG TPA: biliverdin-producing heme oxygenase [Gemmatales bacterium]|nr:biliverdin-producing heme oxygenase [Gemmatales bacterium]
MSQEKLNPQEKYLALHAKHHIFGLYLIKTFQSLQSSMIMPLTQRLRQAMQVTHDQIENLPISLAMAQGSVSRESYLHLLVQMYHLHTGFESLLRLTWGNHPLVNDDQFRASSLEQDLHYFGCSLETLPAALPATTKLLTEFRRWSNDQKICLLGTLYILEGSRMGSMFLAKPMARAMGVEVALNRGLNYHLEGMSSRPATWARWKQQLDHQPFSDSEQEWIIQGACTTMQGLFEIYSQAGMCEMSEKLAVRSNMNRLAEPGSTRSLAHAF